jgi:hypothetical protein
MRGVPDHSGEQAAHPLAVTVPVFPSTVAPRASTPEGVASCPRHNDGGCAFAARSPVCT